MKQLDMSKRFDSASLFAGEPTSRVGLKTSTTGPKPILCRHA